VGDALTVMTVIAFTVYILLAIGLNVMDNNRATVTPAANVSPAGQPATQPAAGNATSTNVPTGGFTPTGTSEGSSGEPIDAEPAQPESDQADDKAPAETPQESDETPQSGS
jgi:hypothetical protein